MDDSFDQRRRRRGAAGRDVTAAHNVTNDVSSISQSFNQSSPLIFTQRLSLCSLKLKMSR